MRTAGIKVIAPVLIVLAVVALAVIIYLFIYRSRVNKALASGGGKDGAGPEPGSVGRSGLIIALIVILGIVLIRMANIGSKLDSANQMLSTQNNQIMEIRNQLADLEDKLDAQESIIAEYSIDYGAFDRQSQTANILVSVTPKSADSSTEVSFIAGSHTVKLERTGTGSRFSGSFTAGLFEKFPDEPEIVITTGGTSRSERIEYYELNDLRLHYIPAIMYSGGGSATYSGGKLDLNWEVQLDFFSKSETAEFLKDGIILKTEIGGKTEEKDISGDITWNDAWGRYSITFKGKYAVEKGQHFKVTVTAKDNMGNTHVFVALDLTEDRPAPEEVYHIYDAAGKQLD